MTPPTTRSLPFTLHGAPAVIAGAAPEARPPVNSHANEATLAEMNVRRFEFFMVQNSNKCCRLIAFATSGLEIPRRRMVPTSRKTRFGLALLSVAALGQRMMQKQVDSAA